MDINFPVPNVACRCGQLLFSWGDVIDHWRKHREAQAQAEEFQKMVRDMSR